MDSKALIRKWRLMSADQKRELADRCDTSVPTLSQLVHGYRPGTKRFWRVINEELKSFSANEINE